jgi:hypothetical protein
MTEQFDREHLLYVADVVATRATSHLSKLEEMYADESLPLGERMTLGVIIQDLHEARAIAYGEDGRTTAVFQDLGQKPDPAFSDEIKTVRHKLGLVEEPE